MIDDISFKADLGKSSEEYKEQVVFQTGDTYPRVVVDNLEEQEQYGEIIGLAKFDKSIVSQHTEVNYIISAYDGDTSTYYGLNRPTASPYGDYTSTITWTFNEIKELNNLYLQYSQTTGSGSPTAQCNLDIEYSEDNINWTSVVNSHISYSTQVPQTEVNTGPISARYIRLTYNSIGVSSNIKLYVLSAIGKI